MRQLRLAGLLSTLLSTMMMGQSASLSGISQAPPRSVTAQPDPANQAKIAASYGKLPLSFEANHGQTDSRVKFLSRISGYSLFLTGDEAVLALSGELRGKKASFSQPRKSLLSADSRGANEQLTSRSGFVSGHRFSDAAHSGRESAPSGAELAASVLRMKLRSANASAKVTGVEELLGTSNYFIGNDPAKWQTNVPTFAKVKYEGVYSGIDLVYYGNQRQLEYDFIVAPGADPSRIALDVSGAERIRQDSQGELVFKVGQDEIRWHRPMVYQEKDGARQEIAARYSISNTNHVGFEVAEYDASRPLYIDPLIYSTFLGGNDYDQGFGIAADSAGNTYVTGFTESANFPVTAGAYQTMCHADPLGCGDSAIGDVFVTKISPSGSLIYSTYLGGTGTDYGYGIAVDNAGDAYITGWTTSTDFPMTPGAFDTVYCKSQSGNCGAGTAFVTKLNSAGSALVYSTYLSGSWYVQANGIAVDSAGYAYVTGVTQAPDFPVTPGAFQTVCGAGDNCVYYYDAFVSKINLDGTALVYSTYLGGESTEYGESISVDSLGEAYVTGSTGSTNFPTTPGALQPSCEDNRGLGCGGPFVTKFNSTGSALIYSTYLGPTVNGTCCEARSHGIAVDELGSAYITGTATSKFPVTPGAFETTGGGGFLAKLNATGSALVYSTFLNNSWPLGIAVDNAGSAYVTGWAGRHFPTTPGAFQIHLDVGRKDDGFVTKFNPSGSALAYSTYLGGSLGAVSSSIAVDRAGNASVTGWTFATDFPTLNPLQPVFGGALDAFVTRLQMLAATKITLASSPNPSTQGEAVIFTAAVTSSDGTPPDGEIVTFIKGEKVWVTAPLSGGSASYATSKLTGNNVITAVYSGDSIFASSKSNVVKQVVNKAKQ